MSFLGAGLRVRRAADGEKGARSSMRAPEVGCLGPDRCDGRDALLIIDIIDGPRGVFLRGIFLFVLREEGW